MVVPGSHFFTSYAREYIDETKTKTQFIPLPYHWLGFQKGNDAEDSLKPKYFINTIPPKSIIPFYESYITSNFNVSKCIPNIQCCYLNKIRFNKVTYDYHYSLDVGHVYVNKIIPVSTTKFWLRKLEEITKMKDKYLKKNPIYINQSSLTPSLWKEAYRCLVQPIHTDMLSVLVEPFNTNEIIAFIYCVTNTTSKIECNNSVSKLKRSLPRTEKEAIDCLIVPFLMTATTELLEDNVRTSKRVTFGWSEVPTHKHRHFKGIPYNDSGLFYPRQNKSHLVSNYSNLFLEKVLPILSNNLDVIQKLIVSNFDIDQDHISKLKNYIDLLPFPHNLIFDEKSNTLVPQNDTVLTACQCMSRMSVSFAAGQDVKEVLVKKINTLYGALNALTIEKTINDNSHTALHLDKRDIGAGGVLLRKEMYTNSGMKVTGCDSKLIQYVTIISYKLNENDALFAIQNTKDSYCYTLKSPKFDKTKELDNSIKIVTYAMDYSNTYHGNITDGKPLPPGSWALRITTYGTNHCSTWNAWLKKQNSENRNFFKKI